MPLEPSARGRDASEASAPLTPRSFAELTAALERLNHLEALIVDLVARSRLPRSEVRRMLRCTTAEEALNAPGMQFMRQIFRQVGMSLNPVKVLPFAFAFEVPDSPYVDLLRTQESEKTCHFAAEAISRFFVRDLGLGCTTEEVTCINQGDSICTFSATLEQEDTREAFLDGTDRLLLKGLDAGEALQDLRLSLDLTPPELENRLGLLSRFGLVSRSGTLTDAGTRHARKPLAAEPEEDFPAPWRELEEVTEAIATAASFAQAARETLTPVERPEAVDPGSAEMAAGARSFAELLGKVTKKTESEDNRRT